MPPITPKSLTMPLAAATMALLLLVYTRTSIGAAKVNARIHREADGGQISWRNESLRQHGQLERPVGGNKGVLAEALDKVSTGRQLPRKGGAAGVDGVGGEEERVKEKAREGKGG